MLVGGFKPNKVFNYFRQDKSKNNLPPLYQVQGTNIIKKAVPTLAFVSSTVGALGYLVGSAGLFYDLHHEKKHGKNYIDNQTEGVKTIKTSTKFGDIGMKCAKIAITATATSGMACGIGEGIPLMAIGEATNFSSAKIIETPIGTGLFGIGIASIFAGLALDNTPELKMNEFEFMAAKPKEKVKLVVKNVADTAKEIGVSVLGMAKNCYKPSFWKNDIFRITPQTVVFSEEINKAGDIVLKQALRHKRSYLMHAASFVLGLGGSGVIAASLLNQKKVQKTALQVEEVGFLADNFGMTKYGIDKLTTGGKTAGASFAIGGAVNAVSQFLGLDNKDGRALQWLGIAGVFLGFSIDRGKHLKQAIANLKQRPELTRVVREWKIDLSEVIKDKSELESLVKALKSGSGDDSAIKSSEFLKIKKTIQKAVGKKYQQTQKVQERISKKLGNDLFSQVEMSEIKNIEKTKEVLGVCTEKLFGSKSPQPV